MEQRRHRRLPASIRIFSRSGPSPFPEPVKDISIGGAHVLTQAPLAVGTESTFAVHLPHHDAPLELEGHVVWAKETEMGVQWHGLEPRFQAFIDRLETDSSRL